MARIIRREAAGPIKIAPEDLPKDKAIFICACGLTANEPFCDGSHTACKSEEPGKSYEYLEDGSRREID